MQTLVKEGKIFTPFVPSLQHLAGVKVAIPVYITLMNEKCSPETEHRISTSSVTDKKEKNWNEHFHFIPKHLRKEVVEACMGMSIEVQKFRKEHLNFLQLTNMECLPLIRWRSDGTVDRVKTAQQVVLDERIDIEARFEVSCMYCLSKSVQNLWVEIVNSGRINGFVPSENSTAEIWVIWMCNGCRDPWQRVIRERLDPFRRWNIRFSCFFPFLEPKDREEFLPSLAYAAADDVRFCLNAMNKEEEAIALGLEAARLSFLYLNWPFQSVFLENIEKMWSLIDFDFYSYFLQSIWTLNESWKGHLYSDLFLDFWNRSPGSLRERARKDPDLKRKIDSLFDGLRRRREADHAQASTRKRKFSQVE